jgi:hypothetical protein
MADTAYPMIVPSAFSTKTESVCAKQMEETAKNRKTMDSFIVPPILIMGNVGLANARLQSKKPPSSRSLRQKVKHGGCKERRLRRFITIPRFLKPSPASLCANATEILEKCQATDELP